MPHILFGKIYLNLESCNTKPSASIEKCRGFFTRAVTNAQSAVIRKCGKRNL